ncbi:cilia- and flagella-associated protein 95-like [Antedon mediterranea]|uniref:cilia- and flagella-associated protein 95-like n=1 Tax=Antedon mediterranea TaxID=105859 RepID=UPI003AF68C89
MAGFVGNPDYYERKGSLFLRSDHMNYGRPTLNSNWHQAREAEPKDYNISDPSQKRNLHTATYERIGNSANGFPRTTTQESMEQVHLKRDFEEREIRKPMVSVDTYNEADIDRDTGCPKTGFGSVLPRHHAGHDKRHLETTNRADYKPPFPYTPVPEQPPDFVDNSNGYRKCQSQFTDTADYRRFGRNTWQDESGIYANRDYKRALFPPTNTIPQQLE